MPVWRNPVSAPTRAFIPSHRRMLLTDSGTSASSRPILRHQNSARLLTGDGFLLAEHDRHAALGQEERGRSADDAAADNDDFGLGRKLGYGLDWIGAWGHQTALLRMAHTLFVCSHSSILEARLSQA